ncbi:FAD binding domain-containing protein [Bosea massiliensis]|uniref:FAD binding domain-containing protein n=1 Tax=Bosea massiliensis TaxID=151419 RepID=A0ABW0PA85_9HYPH
MKPLRISIIGGSLAGLFAGVLLKRDGHDVTVHERSRHGLAGRGSGLVPQHEVFQILRAIGIEHLAHLGVVARERIYLDRSGDIVQTIGEPQTQLSWDVIYEQVAARIAPTDYRLGSQLATVEEDGNGPVTLSFADGSHEKADLVIGADGIGSVVRQTIAPDQAANRYAGYVAWRGLIPETALSGPSSLLLERFAFYVAPGDHALGYLVPGPNGEIARGQRRYNWVWYRRVPEAQLRDLFTDCDGQSHAVSLPRGGLSFERREALRKDALLHLPPPFALAVAAEDTPSIQGIFDYETPAMVGDRMALIGDAAFVVRPHTAMGVGKAAGDVMAVRRHLAAESDLRTALARFESERLPVGREIAAFGQRLGANAL